LGLGFGGYENGGQQCRQRTRNYYGTCEPFTHDGIECPRRVRLDVEGQTLASASSLEEDLSQGSRVESSQAVGQKLAERAKAAGIEKAVFDRNGYRYHGRVKALAEGVREGGLNL
jgi:hypothetical protein